MKRNTDFYLRDKVSREVRDAIWQYFLDHSQRQKNMYWGIMFYVKNEDDFWHRVQSRFLGDFKRYKLEEKNATQRARMDALDYVKRENQKWENKILKIRNGKNIYKKSILFLNKKTRAIIENS